MIVPILRSSCFPGVYSIRRSHPERRLLRLEPALSLSRTGNGYRLCHHYPEHLVKHRIDPTTVILRSVGKNIPVHWMCFVPDAIFRR